MPRRPPYPGAQQVEPQGLPGDGARRRREPLLPRLPLPQLRSVLGAGSPGGLRASEGGGAWWPSGSSHPDVRHPSPRLPAPPTLAQRGAQNRTRLRSLLLPPLLLARAPRELAPRRRGPGELEDPRRGAAREAPDSLRALLGELLPSRFREFLHHLGAKCTEPRPASEASPGLPRRRGRGGAGAGQAWGGVVSGMGGATVSGVEKVWHSPLRMGLPLPLLYS